VLAKVVDIPELEFRPDGNDDRSRRPQREQSAVAVEEALLAKLAMEDVSVERFAPTAPGVYRYTCSKSGNGQDRSK
jgi:hypothetical protein